MSHEKNPLKPLMPTYLSVCLVQLLLELILSELIL